MGATYLKLKIMIRKLKQDQVMLQTIPAWITLDDGLHLANHPEQVSFAHLWCGAESIT